MRYGASKSETFRFKKTLPVKGSRVLKNVSVRYWEPVRVRDRDSVLPRNPFKTTYVDWLIDVIDGKIPKPPTEPVSSLKKIA